MNDTWELIRHDYAEAYQMPIKPDETFCNPMIGTVIDENRTVRWNREEAQRQKTAYADERRRLLVQRFKAIHDVEDRAVALIGEQCGLTPPKARRLWEFVYERNCTYDDGLWDAVEDYIDLIRALKE